MNFALKMNKLLTVFSLIAFACIGCSSEDRFDVSVVGKWELTAWEVEGGFDIDKDGTASINILNEIDCSNNEILAFEASGVIAATMTYNPDLQIALLDGTTDTYEFTISCDNQGIIGLATTYEHEADKVTFNNMQFTLTDNQLSRVIQGGLKIYNEALTEVVATKDLTVVYIRE